MELVNDILRALAIATPVSFAVAWVLRKVFEHTLARDLEGHRSRLAAEQAMHLQAIEAQSQRTLEEFKAQLAATANRDRIRYDVLHSKRSEVTAELYGRFSTLLSSVKQMSGPWRELTADDVAEELDEVMKDGNALWSQFIRTRIYFPKPVAEQVEATYKQIKHAVGLFRDSRDHAIRDASRAEDAHAARDSLWQLATSQEESTLGVIEGLFRELLGVEAVAESA
jgi:hypothetical protein